MIVVPEDFTAACIRSAGAVGQRWTSALPTLTEKLLAQWNLTIDDEPVRFGAWALVIAVRRDSHPCVLKISRLGYETIGAGATAHGPVDEARALAAWDGRGSVQMLASDLDAGALLLERLDATRSLGNEEVFEAAHIAGRLLRRLVIPAPPDFPSPKELTPIFHTAS